MKFGYVSAFKLFRYLFKISLWQSSTLEVLMHMKASEIACLRLVSALAVRSMLDLVIVLLAFPSCPVLSNIVFTVRADPSRLLACLCVCLFVRTILWRA